jgi:hypothetical protein
MTDGPVYIRLGGLDRDQLLDADTDHDESAAHDLADRVFASIHEDYPRLYDDLDGVHAVVNPRHDSRLLQGLDEANDLEYLLALASEAMADDDAFDSDAERARWAVAEWCQEVRYLPDLSQWKTGLSVPPGEQPDSLRDPNHPRLGEEDGEK